MFCIMKYTGYSYLVFKVKKVFMESKWFPIFFDFVIWLLMIVSSISEISEITLNDILLCLQLFIFVELVCCFTRFVIVLHFGDFVLFPSHSNMLVDTYDHFKMYHWCYNSEVYYVPLLEII